MRLSSDRADPGFLPALVGPAPRPRFDVTLDGELVQGVVTADEEEGLVVVHVRDEDGGFRHREGVVLREVHRGVVTITRV